MTCSIHGENRNAYNVLVRILERNRLLVRHRHRREDGTKMDCIETEVRV
jgi:hypothetical protein